MNAVFLFNTEAPSVRGFYGYRVEEAIFLSSVLQRSGEKLLVRGGDVVHGHSPKNFYQTLMELYAAPDYGQTYAEQLFEASLHLMVFAVSFDGISAGTAAALHAALENLDAYLGWKELDYDYPPHRSYFRDGLIDRYLIEGQRITVKGSGFSDGNLLPDHRREELQAWGFTELHAAPSRFDI